MPASSLRAKPGTSSRRPANSRWPSTTSSMSVSATTVALRGRLVEQRELAEGVARAEGRDLAARAGSPWPCRSRITKNSWPVSPSVTSALPAGDPDVLGPPGDQLELLAGAGREQRDLLEVVDEGVAAGHGPGI